MSFLAPKGPAPPAPPPPPPNPPVLANAQTQGSGAAQRAAAAAAAGGGFAGTIASGSASGAGMPDLGKKELLGQ